MRKKVAYILFPVFTILAFSAIKIISFKRPSHFPEPVYNFAKNPLAADKVELGRALFYDPILSADNTISCASCHSPFNSFAHSDHDLSHGIKDQTGTRNAPALINLAWHRSFMWDGAVNHLDVQALAPINHPKEMGESISNVIHKLKKNKRYQLLFQKAFSDSTITGEYVLKALSQFQLTLVSANSKYDRVRLNEESFTEQEKNGYSIFLKHCNACHTEPLFSNYSFANNGLPVDTTLNDYGKYTVTKQSKDSLLFKIPSLRNLSYTFPYMHDGRFKKISQVIQHYTNGIHHTPTLSEELREPIKLSSNEKIDLITFLLTLDDKSFVFDAKHQFPQELINVRME
jgi:cytochrome c peroxidase